MTAQHFEAIKYSLRQSKDGVVVAFVVQPEDVKPELMALAVGARVMVAWSAIGDDEKPVASVATPRDSSERPQPEPPQAQKPKRERTLAEQAALCCADPWFISWFEPVYHKAIIARGDRQAVKIGGSLDACAMALRHYLRIESRSELNIDARAIAMWRTLYQEFRDWQAQQDYGAMAR